MKCELCGGKGWLRGHPLGIQIVCPVCDGKGYVEPTNEEWFCSLSTEDKATFLINATMFYDCGETLPFVGALRKASESDFKPYKWLHKDVVKWLKEKHNEMP